MPSRAKRLILWPLANCCTLLPLLAPPVLEKTLYGSPNTIPRSTEARLELRHPIEDGYWFQNKGKATVRFVWKTQLDGVQFKLRVAKNCMFAPTETLFEQSHAETPYLWNTGYAGPACWQISVVDKNGQLLASSEKRHFLITPRVQVLSASQKNDRVMFQWESPYPGSFTQFKLARSPKFKPAYMTLSVDTKMLNIFKLNPGDFFWKVGTRQSADSPLVFSQIQKITVVAYEATSPPALPSTSISLAAKKRFAIPLLSTFETSIAEPTRPLAETVADNILFALPKAKGVIQEVPEVLLPRNGEILFLLEGESVTLRWKRPLNAEAIQLQIASNEALSNSENRTIFDEKLNFIPKGKEIYWRIRSFGSDGSFSEWTPVQSFAITALPQTIELIEPKSGSSLLSFKVRFRWQQQASCNSYQIKISQSKSFDRLLQTLEAAKPSTEVELDNEGTYYWSVACDADSGSTQRSSASSFTVRSDD